jgi:cyclophilin family peptidyl-prolyl cis-trans isomerase
LNLNYLSGEEIMNKFVAGFLLIASLSSAAISESMPQVTLTTNYGDIVVQLDSTAAPKTVVNFLDYVNSKFYDGTIFHRVIKTFMIQGGGMTPDMKEKPTRAPIPNEANNGLKNMRGTIAMARTSDPNSATAQFFINTANNPPLDFRDKSVEGWGYCVFGKVVKGINVVDSIANVKTTSVGMYDDVPVTTIEIKKALRVAKPKTTAK